MIAMKKLKSGTKIKVKKVDIDILRDLNATENALGQMVIYLSEKKRDVGIDIWRHISREYPQTADYMCRYHVRTNEIEILYEKRKDQKGSDDL